MGRHIAVIDTNHVHVVIGCHPVETVDAPYAVVRDYQQTNTEATGCGLLTAVTGRRV